MKFEFVDFYPALQQDKRKHFIGTVHIYAIDCQLDIRGIIVRKRGASLFFSFPHFNAFDEDENKIVRYPHIHFTDSKVHQEMLDFLHKKVAKEIFKLIRK